MQRIYSDRELLDMAIGMLESAAEDQKRAKPHRRWLHNNKSMEVLRQRAATIRDGQHIWTWEERRREEYEASRLRREYGPEVGIYIATDARAAA